MGNPMGSRAQFHLEHNIYVLSGLIAIDGSSNVIGGIPTATPPGAGPYTVCKGIQKALGPAGGIITQPHTATGTYIFTLDEPWFSLLDYDVAFLDQGAVAQSSPSLQANVRANTTAADAGQQPGTDPTLTAQTLKFRFRHQTTGALQDPVASTGFWIRVVLKNTAIG